MKAVDTWPGAKLPACVRRQVASAVEQDLDERAVRQALAGNCRSDDEVERAVVLWREWRGGDEAKGR